MRSMQFESVKLPHQTVTEEVNTCLTFHLHLGVNDTRTAAQCLLNCVAYAQVQFVFAMSNY